VSSLTCIFVMVLVLKFWKPANVLRLETDKPVAAVAPREAAHGGEMFMAWVPYLLLVVFVLLWATRRSRRSIDRWTDSLMPAFLPKPRRAATDQRAGPHN
jgi:L-lactate permease